jgi:hypothetical protein
MVKNLCNLLNINIKISFISWLIFVLPQFYIHANTGDDKPNDKDKPKQESVVIEQSNIGYTTLTDVKKQAELNAFIKKHNAGNNSLATIKVDKMEDIKGFVSAAAVEGRSDANKLFRYLDQKNEYKQEGQQLEDSDLLKLPIGLKKQFGNTTADVGVLSAQFFPEYAEIALRRKRLACCQKR